MPLPKESIHTVQDIYSLPNGQRAELIDGHMYMTAPPSRIHQRISTRLASAIDRYITDNQGICEGSPDWIIEIVSPGSHRMDYQIKLFKYRTAGVRKYFSFVSAIEIPISNAAEEIYEMRLPGYFPENDSGSRYLKIYRCRKEMYLWEQSF